MVERKANFVPVSALDKRTAVEARAAAGIAATGSLCGENFQLYFRNAWRRQFLRTKVVAPYAVYVLRPTNAIWRALLHAERAGRLQRGVADERGRSS